MTSPPVIAYELKRVIVSRKFFYLLLLLTISSYDTLTRLLADGAFGTPPFSQVSFTKYAILSNLLLLLAMALLCTNVFSEKELAVRKILFSAPISARGYFAVKGIAIGAAFAIAATWSITLCFIFYAWQFRFYQFGDFLHPILVFIIPPAVFVFGLCMALGRVSGSLIYALMPILFFWGGLNLNFPVWVDLSGNHFITNYPLALIRSIGTTEIVYHVPTDFLVSRVVLLIAGVALFGIACRKMRC